MPPSWRKRPEGDSQLFLLYEAFLRYTVASLRDALEETSSDKDVPHALIHPVSSSQDHANPASDDTNSRTKVPKLNCCYGGLHVCLNLSRTWFTQCVHVHCLFNSCYYSFKIYQRFWLAKSARIIHHNQLLMTKFGRILRLINRRQKCSFLAG